MAGAGRGRTTKSGLFADVGQASTREQQIRAISIRIGTYPQNESGRYNLAHPFSHDRSFRPMFEQRSLHPSARLGRSDKRPPKGDGCRFGFVITERPCRYPFDGDMPALAPLQGDLRTDRPQYSRPRPPHGSRNDLHQVRTAGTLLGLCWREPRGRDSDTQPRPNFPKPRAAEAVVGDGLGDDRPVLGGVAADAQVGQLVGDDVVEERGAEP